MPCSSRRAAGTGLPRFPVQPAVRSWYPAMGPDWAGAGRAYEPVSLKAGGNAAAATAPSAVTGRMPRRAYTGRAWRRSRGSCVANASPPSEHQHPRPRTTARAPTDPGEPPAQQAPERRHALERHPVEAHHPAPLVLVHHRLDQRVRRRHLDHHPGPGRHQQGGRQPHRPGLREPDQPEPQDDGRGDDHPAQPEDRRPRRQVQRPGQRPEPRRRRQQARACAARRRARPPRTPAGAPTAAWWRS